MKDYEEKVLNIMDNAKDHIKEQLDRAYKSGYEDAESGLVKKAYKDGYEKAKSELEKKVIALIGEESDRTYQQGLEDAWEAAKKITLDKNDDVGLSLSEMAQIFHTASYDKILKENTASEAIAKIKEYEEQQKQDTIQVGDEVQSCDIRYIVVRIRDNGTFEAIGACGTDEGLDLSKFHKTGRHFDAIAKVLAEMRGEIE